MQSSPVVDGGGHQAAGSPDAPPEPLARLMALTGRADGPPLAPPAGVAEALDSLVAAIGRASALVGERVDLDWGSLVCGRADLLGLTRAGRRSANGSCRLVRAADGWVAVNLPRPDDLASVGALLGEACGEPWAALEAAVPRSQSAELVARARLLGLPVAPVPEGAGPRGGPATAPPAPPRARPVLAGRAGRRRVPPPGGRDAGGGRWRRRPSPGSRVVDCSAMWAGPLAARILAASGARVLKVESTSRPDAARRTPEFYRWLHPHGQEEVRLDLGTPSGRGELRGLIEGADVVIESSRPRAFEQLGVGPRQVAPRAGRVWLAITGYGRHAPGRDWVAFGDDAAVAGGLVGWEADDAPVFCGDAMADPVTGLVGALAVLRALAAGGGTLLDVAMSGCAASIVAVAPVRR